MLVSHLVPQQMQWQSRMFNDFDVVTETTNEYIEDADVVNRLIVVYPDVKHQLKNNVFSIIKNEDFKDTLEQAKSTKQPIVELTGDFDAAMQQFMNSELIDIGIGIKTFEESKRGQNELERKMFARYSAISKYKADLIRANKRVWLLGLAQPYEVKYYGKEVYACIDDITVRESFWRVPLNAPYNELHTEYPEDPIVPLGVYEGISEFKTWLR